MNCPVGSFDEPSVPGRKFPEHRLNQGAAKNPMRMFGLDTVDSTNEEAKRLVLQGSIRGVACITAREQTQGKGSRGRRWASPRDAGIYLSVVHTQRDDDPEATVLFTKLAGIACVELLRARCAVDACIKPINDLYVGGGKLGGILAETVVTGGRVRTVITGIGLNVRRQERILEPGAVAAVSLEELMPAEPFRRLRPAELAAAIASAVAAWYEKADSLDRDSIEGIWRTNLQPRPPLKP